MKAKYYFRTVLSNKKLIDSRQFSARETVALINDTIAIINDNELLPLTRIVNSSVYRVGSTEAVRVLL